VVTVVSQVLVDADDPAFGDPSKPVGPFLTEQEARRRRDELGWAVKGDSGRGWRRLVPSPRPRRVVQRHMVRDAARAGHIVIAAGGGGIPIIEQPDGSYHGIEAVIDKDLTSSVLGVDVGAELLIILTAVPHVYVNFGQPDQQPLGAVTIDELQHLHEEGHFPEGSMGPKVEAAIHFLNNGGRRVLITNPEGLPQAIEGRGGTHFIGRI
jgi:carbamate kinase